MTASDNRVERLKRLPPWAAGWAAAAGFDVDDERRTRNSDESPGFNVVNFGESEFFFITFFFR
jgi:hypothetical protein